MKLEDLLERHVEAEEAEKEGVERKELEEARRVLQEKRAGLRRLEDSTEVRKASLIFWQPPGNVSRESPKVVLSNKSA